MRPESFPKLSIVVVTFGREAMVVETLQDLLRQDHPHFDITVVDQNPQPKEALRELAAASGGKIRMIHLRPPHMCVARNVGINATDGETVLFVDDDIRCGEGLASAHARAYSDPSVGGVAGWIDAATPERVWKPERPFVEYAIGCNMSYRRKALVEAGGFDPHFKPFPALGEEKDLAYRVRRLGYKIATSPEACLFHQVCPSGGSRAQGRDQYWIDTTSCHVLLFKKTRPWRHQILMPVWLLRLWWTLSRLAGGEFPLRNFSKGVREGYECLRQSRTHAEFLSMAPEPQWVALASGG